MLFALHNAGGKALTSAEAAKAMGLFTCELSSPSKWLLARGFIVRTNKRVKIEFAGRDGHNVFAFWSLSDKGRAYVVDQKEREVSTEGV